MFFKKLKQSILMFPEAGYTFDGTTTLPDNLESINVETNFNHIPDWYKWQRDYVRQEVIEGNIS